MNSKQRNFSILLFAYIGIISVLVFFSMGDTSDVVLPIAQNLLLYKIAQVFSVAILFGVPYFLYAFWFKTTDTIIHKSQFVLPLKISIIACLCMVMTMPIINLIGFWNLQMQFPEFLKPLEEIMRAGENRAQAITEVFLNMKTGMDLVVNLIVIGLSAAVFEELFFRGTLQQHFTKSGWNIHWAIWISAFLFSALHGQFFGFIPRFLLGALLGYIYHWSGSLLLAIMCHFLNNGLAVVLHYIFMDNQQQVAIDDFGTNSDDYVWVLFAGLACIGLIGQMVKWYKNQPRYI